MTRRFTGAGKTFIKQFEVRDATFARCRPAPRRSCPSYPAHEKLRNNGLLSGQSANTALLSNPAKCPFGRPTCDLGARGSPCDKNTNLAGVALDHDVAALANLAGFGGDGVRGTGVRAAEVVVVQLVLGSHGAV